MRIIIRTSRLAIWSRRLGSFSIAVLLVAIGLHLIGQITPDDFEIIIVLASALAALALVMALAGFAVLWQTGERGWGLATFGLFSSLIALSPAGLLLGLYLNYPATLDIATELSNPPALALSHPQRLSAASGGAQDIAARYPNLVTRHYQVPAGVVHGLIETLARENGWTVLRSRPPTEQGQIATLNARRTTLWGWTSEIAFRIVGDTQGSSVSIRAASLRDQWHDFGDNGRTAENALLALDEAVTIYVRDGLAVIEDEDLPEVILDDDGEAL